MLNSLPHITVLLVEDDAADRLMFIDLLREVAPNLEVHQVEHGQEALQFLKREGEYRDAKLPNLIILDLNMPVMNGFEFLKEAKNLDVIKRIPILVMSTSDRLEDIERSYDSQAAGYIVKPGNYAQYLETLSVVKAYWAGAVKLPTIEDLSVQLT